MVDLVVSEISEFHRDAEMKKYYLMAIAKGNVAAMNNMAVYYYEMKNYTEMEKYNLMAIQLGNPTAIKMFQIHHANIRFRMTLYLYCCMMLAIMLALLVRKVN